MLPAAGPWEAQIIMVSECLDSPKRTLNCSQNLYMTLQQQIIAGGHLRIRRHGCISRAALNGLHLAGRQTAIYMGS